MDADGGVPLQILLAGLQCVGKHQGPGSSGFRVPVEVLDIVVTDILNGEGGLPTASGPVHTDGVLFAVGSR